MQFEMMMKCCHRQQQEHNNQFLYTEEPFRISAHKSHLLPVLYQIGVGREQHHQEQQEKNTIFDSFEELEQPFNNIMSSTASQNCIK
jgi:hypothetical protein